MGIMNTAMKAGKANSEIEMANATAKGIKDVCSGEKTVGEAAVNIGKAGAVGFGSKAAGTAAMGCTTALIASSGVGAAVGGTAVGALCVAAAPMAVGIAAASVVGSVISSLFDW